METKNNKPVLAVIILNESVIGSLIKDAGTNRRQ